MAKVAGCLHAVQTYCRKTWVRKLADQIQMDLVDMQKYSKENGGNRWILTLIEILSRYAFAILVYRKDTKNMTAAVRKLLRQFHDRFGTYPKLAQFDDGKEFYNISVKDLLDKHDVKYFSTLSERKACRIIQLQNFAWVIPSECLNTKTDSDVASNQTFPKRSSR